MKQFIKYIALIVCACSCWACMDDEIGQEIDYSKPAKVKMSIDFSEMQMVTPGTRSAGDAIGKITDLCVLFYNAQGNLAKDENNDPIYYYTTVNSQEPVENIEKTVPAGAYKVVAVANMGNLVTSGTYKGTVERLTDLKAISLQWDNENIAKNNQMFGFFDFTKDNSIDEAITKKGMNQVAPTSYDAPVLLLAGSKTIFAKLYRTVAKVTVAFNGEGLNANVFVTINSIRLGNLPKSSPLWVENREVKDTLDANSGNIQSEILDTEDFGLLKVTNRGQGESTVPQDAHSQTGPSLFVFENRQGTETTTDHKDKTKAKKPYGTFIEIEAYYANEKTGSNGKIIYRYMLGEDLPKSYDNYNLTRNRHYKVTLMLQKSGKEDPYWRVEYKENPSITLPTEVNISYRNSAKLDIPFEVKNAENVSKVEAQIISNPWFDDLIDGHRDATFIEETSLKGEKYGFLAWAGYLSDNNNYGSNKTEVIIVQPTEKGKYKLSVQTESLGFKTDRGNETADSFTGYNNYSNPRTAEVEVTVTYTTGSTKTAKVKIVQVPRIVNPVAVYRSWNNATSFKIRLLNALGREIDSYGPWKAEVEIGAKFFEIKRENGTSYGNEISSGDEGGAIRFDYKPKSTLANAKEVRCGVIVVRFSNYNVEHRIYVRQGYAPMAIGESPSLWTSYNYIGKNQKGQHQLTSSPIEEGAWLKYGNTVGILANNSDNKDEFEQAPKKFKMSDGTSLAWNNFIPSFMPSIPGYEFPNAADIENLYSLREHSGFGIAYDDKATETVAFDEEAQYTNSAMGRRGFVICDDRGRNMFLPTGKRGYGRRKYTLQGGLHYTHAMQEPLTQFRPALAGLPQAMGAIYWADADDMLSLNYSLSNIEKSNKGDNGLNLDACFIRLLKSDNN